MQDIQNRKARYALGAATVAVASVCALGCAVPGAFAADDGSDAAGATSTEVATAGSGSSSSSSGSSSSAGASGGSSSASTNSSSSSSSSSAKKNTTVTKYTLKDVVLYKKASTPSKKLKTVAVATKVTQLSATKTWSKVKAGKTTGYIKVSALTTSKSKADAAKKKIVAARKAAAKKRWETPSTAKKAGKWRYKGSGKSKHKVSYRYKDGTYPTGITKIGKTIYYFKNQKGSLSRSSSVRRVVKVGSKYYYVNGSSVVKKGWEVIGGSLYDFAGKYHAALTNKKRSGITLASNGKAVMNLEAAVKKKCISLLNRITNRNAAKYIQLRAAWNYTVGGGFYYSHILINPWNGSWAKRYANQMLTLKGGSCYGFAAVFAALAHEIGYSNVRVAWGTLTNGNPHSAVLINGLWYDPEEQYNGYIYGIYGSGGNPSNFASYSSRAYSSFSGSGADRGVTSGYRSSKSISVVKKGNKYYGYKGSSASLTGVYKIGGKLYKFNKKHYMTKTAYTKLNKAAKRNKPWSALRKLLGKPKSSYSAVSCYGNGKDVVYKYAHVSVSCFKPAKGGKVVVESVSAR